MIKSFAAVFVASAGLAIAQTGLGEIPDCAQPCLDSFSGGGQIAGCQALDVKCICENQDFLGQIACCLIENCNAEQQKDTIEFAHAMCRTQQVTNLPNEIVCSTATSGNAAATSSVPSATNTGAAADAETSSTPNAGPVPTMAPAGILGGLIAAAALL